MSRRIVRLIVAVGLALSMMLVSAGGALAFAPPGNSGLDGFDFPAITEGPFEVFVEGGMCHPTLPNGGPWNAVDIGPFGGPLEFGTPADPANCAT